MPLSSMGWGRPPQSITSQGGDPSSCPAWGDVLFDTLPVVGTTGTSGGATELLYIAASGKGEEEGIRVGTWVTHSPTPSSKHPHPGGTGPPAGLMVAGT